MYGQGETALAYSQATPAVCSPLVVERIYDGFRAEIGRTTFYAEAEKWATLHGEQNTASYFAKTRIIRDGVTIWEKDFPPYRSSYKGD
jgi:hypothetical protein